MRYVFADFELDAGGHELRRGGARIEAAPKELAVLHALVRVAPRVVTRAELLDIAWGGRRVSPSTLSTVIKSLRRSLGDDRQRLVRTVHGVGYAFTGSVQRHGTSAGVSVSADDRRRLFVGRALETDRLTAWWRDTTVHDGACLYWVHGRGGVGKTSLLHQVEALATERGIPVFVIACAHVRPSPDALLEAIATACGASSGADVFRTLAGLGPAMLVLDGYEAFRGLDDWVRERFIDRLPEGVRLVIAGRLAPCVRWRADPCWLHAVELPLADLVPGEADALLERRGVAADERAAIVRSAGGHPLTLVVAALHRDSQVGEAGETEAVTSSLVTSLLRTAPSQRHREALECLAVAEALDEGLLASLFGDDDAAADAFEWLATLGMVEHASTGLVLHDLAKDTLVRDLAWKNPPRLGRLVEHVSSWLFEAFEAAPSPVERRRIAGALCRNRAMHPSVAPLLASRFEVGVPSAAEVDAIVAHVERFEGAASAGTLRFWLARDPTSPHVLRDSEGALRGYGVLVRIEPDDEEAREVDPVIRRLDAAWPVRAPFSSTRWFADCDAYHAVTPAAFQCHVASAERDLCELRDDLAFHAVVLDARTDWGHIERALAFRDARVPLDVDGRALVAIVHDMRGRSLLAWFRQSMTRLVAELSSGAVFSSDVQASSRTCDRTAS